MTALGLDGPLVTSYTQAPGPYIEAYLVLRIILDPREIARFIFTRRLAASSSFYPIHLVRRCRNRPYFLSNLESLGKAMIA